MNIELEADKIISIIQNINTKLTYFSNSDSEDDDNYEEIDNLIESACHIIDDSINQNPNELSNPKFEDILKQHVENILSEQLKECIEESKIYYILENVYNVAHNTYFSNIMPCRSYMTTFIRKIPKIENMKKKIEYLKSKPQPDQRTNEWYLRRYNMITASNAWKTLDSQSNINSIIYEKCVPLDTSKNDSLNTSTAFHWGHKYEPLSVMYYEYKYKTIVEDYGCIGHDDYPFLGASPDGINVDCNSYRYGRMLEIKNPVNRELTGIPKKEYWIQMQLQMEVCNLNECDFLETTFKEYEGKEEFDNDGDFTTTEDGKLKGIIMYFIDNGSYHYEYAPLYITQEEFEIWENKMMEKNESKLWLQNIYWRLHDVSCILVLRNKFWFKNSIEKIENIWKTIEHERVNGYEHRAPVRREKKNNTAQENTEHKAKCLINVKQVSNVDDGSYNNISIPDSQIDKFKRIRTESFDEVNKEKLLDSLKVKND